MALARHYRTAIVGVALGGLAVIGVGTGWWRYERRQEVLRLPAPDLAAAPAALRERVVRLRGKLERTDDLGAVAELGRLYQANHALREADACWALLTRRQPREARWPHYRADICRELGDQAGAIARLRETVARDPTYAPAWLRLADTELKAGAPDAAARAYRERLQRVPADPYARLGLARVALLAGKSAEAERALREIIHDSPAFSSAHNLYAELLQGRGDAAGAADQRWQAAVAGRFREADDPWLAELRADCYDSRQLVVWGSAEAQTGGADRARALFERAIALAPGEPAAYAELGQLLLDHGDPPQARAVLEQGAAHAAFDETLSVRLSDALRRLGDTAAAMANDERALGQAPDSADLLNSMGESLIAAGRLAEAERTLARARTISPNAVGPLLNLADIAVRTGRRGEARRLLESALTTHPDHPKLLVALGSMALDDGRLDDAERVIVPYFQAYPGNANARRLITQLHADRAMAAFRKDDLAAAEHECAAGLAAVPDAPELLGMLGNIRLRQGDVVRALAAMEACQRQLPGDPRAVLPLAQLYQQLHRPADARRVLVTARDWLNGHGGADAAAAIDAMLGRLPGP